MLGTIFLLQIVWVYLQSIWRSWL